MTNTESFGRGRIVDTILESTTVPFTLRVSKVPVQENQFITINPDTTEEEIFFYTTKTGTIGEAGTLNITGRGYNVNDEVQDVSNQRQHDENSEYKLALNHIIINRKADLDDSKFTGELRVPVFADAAERDSVITAPEDGLLAYLQDIEDFTSYKNGIWINGLGGGGSATYYQDSTSDGTLVGAIDGVNTTFTMSNAPASPTAVLVMYNGIVQELGGSDDYTITGLDIEFNTAPITGKVTAIYPDTPVGSGNSQTREIPASASIEGELFRNTDDSSNLYYKDQSGDLIKVHDDATNRIDIPQSTDTILGVNTIATDAEALTGTDTVKTVTSKQLGDVRNVAFLQTTRDSDAASTTESIAHGLGYTPSKVEIVGMYTNPASDPTNNLHSHGYSDGVNNVSTFIRQVGGSGTPNYESGNNGSNAVYFSNGDSSSNTDLQAATISFDDTNVDITWVFTDGGVSGNITMNFTLVVYG